MEKSSNKKTDKLVSPVEKVDKINKPRINKSTDVIKILPDIHPVKEPFDDFIIVRNSSGSVTSAKLKLYGNSEVRDENLITKSLAEKAESMTNGLSASENRRIKALEEDKETSVLSISIDGQWSSYDFSDFFNSINKIYIMIDNINRMIEWKNALSPMKYKSLLKYTYHSIINDMCFYRNEFGYFMKSIKYPIYVKSIKYGSPGTIDLVGIGQIFIQIKEIIFAYIPNKITKKEIEIKEQERIKILIENLKSINVKDEDIQRIVFQNSINVNILKQLGAEKKIKAIDIYEEN